VIDPLLLDFPDTLETERLILRPPRRSDAEVIYNAIMESQAELARWMPWAVNPTLEDSIKYTRRRAAHFIQRENFAFDMWRKADDEYVGHTSLHGINWEHRLFETGYWLRTSMVGNGYAIEAVNAILHFCFEVLEANRVEIRCEADNERSANVARRTGFKQEARLRMAATTTAGLPNDELVFGMIRAEYDALIHKKASE
jgi:RimJ/RimL family protein N-acetyltransferase